MKYWYKRSGLRLPCTVTHWNSMPLHLLLAVVKLPGVVVDNEGNITANGRPVSKVRVDGKDFFGGDPRIALRNLTSDMISKVQITDDREEDPQHLLAEDEVDQVINLKLKKNARIKAFGKAYAGGGTRDRF